MADFKRFTLPRGAIRRHMQETRKHREPTSAPPPAAMPGNPAADIPRWTIESGRDGLTEILDRASGRLR
jgi:hypothetical protein